MPQTVNLEAIKNEIVRYGNRNPMVIERAVLSKEIYLNKLAKPLAKIKGKWNAPSLFMTHVVQIFNPEWNPYGDLEARLNEMKNFHQKVNFEFLPYEVYGTWLEEMYHEEKKPNEMPISKYVVNDLLLPKIIDDLNILSVTGKYDDSQKGQDNPTFGTSMDGLNEVIKRHEARNYFKIPVDAGSNIVDQITAFEKQLPKGVKIPYIMISAQDFDDYVELRETPNNQFVNLKDPHRARTKYQRELVAIPGMTKGKIVAFMDGTFFSLYDRKDDPARIDDVQIQDYKMKIFSQWHLGYDFGASEFLFISSTEGDAKRGLNDEKLNKLIYPGEYGLTTI